jgi:hypothetical protein
MAQPTPEELQKIVKAKQNAMTAMDNQMLEIKQAGGEYALDQYVNDNIDQVFSILMEKRRENPVLFKLLGREMRLSDLINMVGFQLMQRPDQEWQFIPIFLQTVKPQFQFKIFNLLIAALGGEPLPPESEPNFLKRLEPPIPEKAEEKAEEIEVTEEQPAKKRGKKEEEEEVAESDSRD